MAKLMSCDVAVLDVETTGKHTPRLDRIVEIAVVRLGVDGGVCDEFVTLVNPERDVGPTSIHGLTARDVLNAPRFAEILPDVLSVMKGAIVAAHNVRFDLSFLSAETERVGLDLRLPHLCTLELASFAGATQQGRSLPACCEHFGIDIERHHSALADARAAAGLLRCCAESLRSRGVRKLGHLVRDREALIDQAWPDMQLSGRAMKRGDTATRSSQSPNYLAQLVTRLMGPSVNAAERPEITAYFELLDRVLEDRQVEASEAASLHDLALTCALTGEQVIEAHRNYLDQLAHAALSDSVVTECERRDLEQVTALLGFDARTLDDALARAQSGAASVPTTFESLAGKKVCFTGELAGRLRGAPLSREMAETLAVAAGLEVLANVTKKLDILVVADVATQSSKAKKARDYGKRIMAEPAFWRAIGATVE